ncbi:hypothetical protein GCM10010468_28490 [Actinocorallia longicatena]|uniref:Tachylectin n=1 Tax=Actinocorallia longicatena TaxID=111803 RepID=A0ABP6Q942_9ACTN
MPLPFLWPNNAINGLAVQNPSSVWVAGYQGQYCVRGPSPYSCLLYSPGNPVVRRWDGTRWLEYPLGSAPKGPIHAVGASGAEVWIADISGYLARFDGTAFTKVATPMGLSASPLSVNPAGVWVKQFISSTGEGGQFRWTGSGWAETAMPPGVRGISGEVSSVVAGEAWAKAYVDGAYVLLRWNGTSWADAGPIPSLGPYSTVHDLDAVGPGEAVAVVHPIASSADPSRAYRYKDGVWTQIPTPGLDLTGVTVDGLGRLYGLGTEIYRYDGSAWQEQAFPGGALTPVPGSDAFWAHRTPPTTVSTNS